jgi:DNA-binding SARP family transcriptional activator/tetratricopeptide (TPR) repeat protein/TolB-like protein
MPRFRLLTLGRLALIDPSGEENEIGKRRRKLALLAVLALSRRPMSRDTLIDLFWGEEPEVSARHSLSDALSHLRRVLGKDAILSGRSDVVLAKSAALDVDVIQLAAALAAGDHPRVIELYTGPFLDGFRVADSIRFDEWSSRERDRIERAFIASCAAVCKATANGTHWDDCAHVASRWLEIDADSVDAANYLAAAHAARMSARAPVPAVVPPPPPVPAFVAAQIVPKHRWRRLAAVAAFSVVAVIVIVTGVRVVRRDTKELAASTRQVVAIVDVNVARGDSSLVWLQDGFALMITANLARTSTIEVVPAGRVRSVLARGNRDAHSLDAAGNIDVARRLGARWAVTSSLRRTDGAYVAQLVVHDVAGGDARLFTISGTNVLTVADQVAARVRNVTDAATPGPQLADVETSNLAAFEHFVRANQAADEGRFADQLRELDAAVAADSGFTSALVARMRIARYFVDTATVARLAKAYDHASSRITRWDQLELAEYLALHNGEHARAEQLARALVDAYPHDPRAYQALATTLSLHGKFSSADSVLWRALRLDSLAMASGHGPCVPCATYSGLVDNAAAVGNLVAAERASRQWLALQPDLPAAWATLASVLAYGGHYDAALDAERHAAQLAGDDAEYELRIGRILVMARRLGVVDSLIKSWHGGTREYQIGALDLESVVERERGQFRASERTLHRLVDEYHDGGLELVRANSLAHTGLYAEAGRMYERITPHGNRSELASPVQSLAGDRARTFAWHHALEADALSPTRDTVHLRLLADSIEQLGARSYYARDWHLHHHVRGLIAQIQGRPADASREMTLAQFGLAGWTRTNAALAESRLALNDAAGALVTLRVAYESPPDAMGRYLPRSEIDYWMARAFAVAHMADSARVYSQFAVDAWAKADAELGTRRREMLLLGASVPR